MPLVYGLLVVSLIDIFWIKCFLVIAYSIVLLKKSSKYKTLLFVVLCIGLFLSYQYGTFQSHSTYKAIKINEHYTVLQSGTQRLVVYDNSFEFGAYYDFKGNIVPYSNLSSFQVVQRIVGSANVHQFVHIREPNIASQFINKIAGYSKDLFGFIHVTDDTIVGSLSIHLYALEYLIKSGLRRVLDKKSTDWWVALFYVLYGCLFSFEVAVVRLILKSLCSRKDIQMIGLILVFPRVITHPSFLISYGPTLIKNFSEKTAKAKDWVLRIVCVHISLRSLNLIYSVMFPLIVRIYAFVYVCIFFRLYDLATLMIQWIRETTVILECFTIFGKISIVFIPWILLGKHSKNVLSRYLISVLFIIYYPFARVMFLDVGQGDSTVIITPFNAHVTLIDTGRAFAYGAINNTLNDMGINKIDQLIITHDDIDHNENQQRIIETFNVESLVTEKGEAVRYLTELLSDYHYTSTNENSLIYILETKRLKFLFTGDASTIQENELVRLYPELKIDILKLGHHGSSTSTGNQFLRSIQPLYAISSSNPKNYGHPHSSVLSLLNQYRIVHLGTHDQGNITFILTGLFDFVVSEDMRFGIIR